MIRPAHEIFDLPAVTDRLAQTIDGVADPMEIRRQTVAVLSSAMADGRAVIAAGFSANPHDSRSTTHAYAWLTDCVVTLAFTIARGPMQPAPIEGDLTMVAVGGYGRGEMAPFSDVDLLFITRTTMTRETEAVIEALLYTLWDLKLKVGHSSRTVDDCLQMARQDFTIRTSMVEARFIAGKEALFNTLRTRLWNDVFKNTAGEFIEAKLTERAERHVKQGGQRYMVEPNVKEGKGGLRDLQSLYWIGKYVYNVQDAAQLVKKGVFTADEYDTFRLAEDFLWAVRCHLHLIAGRAVDLLSFDMQVEVAARMGYRDRGGRRAVEHFMQDYFRHATKVGELTRIFLTVQEDKLIKPVPMLSRLFTRKRPVAAPYALKNNRLTVADEKAFLADNLNLLRIFEESVRMGASIHPDALRLVAANLHLIDDAMRESRAANRIFLDLMLRHGNPARILRHMNEIGVLAAFIPEFEPIVAMMQFNMYHHYTVDEHTFQCISNLSQIEAGKLHDDLPLVSDIVSAGISRRVIYVALLLHDIGKGREEDHSVLGAQIARRVAPRLGLSKRETETVEWLIRHHLLMSDTAQKRDISEPRTVRAFAKMVESRERLDLLTVLTVCDIRGVGPGTWNNWKAALIRSLHRSTTEVLAIGPDSLSRHTREDEAKRALREALADWPSTDLRAETARHYGPYWQGLPHSAHLVFANLLRGISDTEIRIDLTPDPERDATRASFAMADHPGLFSRMTGALALVGANVVDARTYTSKDGYATATFWVQDADGRPFEAARLPRLRQMIDRTMKGEVVPREAMKERDKIKKRERAFNVPTLITFDNEGSDIYTIIEVDTRDRPGLLHDLVRTLAAQNANLASAVIATYGEQAVDTFYVKDMFGLKFHAEGRRQQLEAKLREAIAQGAERARS
ncbi:UTP-GlnB uridylyltransferase [Ketogulonicigenium robustum]|uniref:Bifunctional uridylyltransferase/uridylyl-removing enzyme n=1 Tax=Ketogulonicigenium robustum TaxID=92947 RepID=A0A1W6NWH9_9RHOB|nr:[protein-PII] uridylyltransferase [Ketogulonicigenium robustum]ARO13618.1 UTP-GlnB uridylyltransferase [Ketogulonicigenium robustum]